jgi:DNA helicase-2/ATP-dependent DNA helicase PcrA
MTEVLRKFIKDVGFEKEISTEETDEKVMKARMLNLSELANMMSYFEEEWDSEGKPTLFDFIARLSLLTNDDDSNETDKRDNRIQLMTMHLSKGLEFEVVFLVGIEEGIIPNSRVIEESQNVDEERRTFPTPRNGARGGKR